MVISRRLDLSYFDHPPLHQWIAHFTGRLLGEGLSMRLPFIALFAGTGWLMYLLTRKLFGARAGVWAVFGLNASAFFFASAGSWIVPDGPLLFALAAAAIVFAKLFFEEADAGAVWRLWLAGGFWLGVAALSKYSAVFFAFGLVAFIVLSPRQRHWLAHPAPYLAGRLCLAIVSPVLVWNAQNDWVSLAFQGARGAPHGQWRPVQVAAMILGQIVWVTPWIFVPLAGAPDRGGAVGAARRSAPAVSSVPVAAADRAFQPDAVVGRQGIAALADARVVLHLSVARRLAQRRLGATIQLARLGDRLGGAARRGRRRAGLAGGDRLDRAGRPAAGRVTDPTREALNWDAWPRRPCCAWRTARRRPSWFRPNGPRAARSLWRSGRACL